MNLQRHGCRRSQFGREFRGNGSLFSSHLHLGWSMAKNPVLDLPLGEIMRSEIALRLQHVLHLYTVGNFLSAWRNPRTTRASSRCSIPRNRPTTPSPSGAAWLGINVSVSNDPAGLVWPTDQKSQSIQANRAPIAVELIDLSRCLSGEPTRRDRARPKPTRTARPRPQLERAPDWIAPSRLAG